MSDKQNPQTAFQVLPGCVPSQSASERINGLVKFTTRHVLQNNFSWDARVASAVICDKYRKLAACGKKRKHFDTRAGHWDDDDWDSDKEDLSEDADARPVGAGLDFEAPSA